MAGRVDLLRDVVGLRLAMAQKILSRRVRAGSSVPALARLANLWHHQIMKSTLDSAKKRKKGRPPVESMAVNVRLPMDAVSAIDDWRRRQDDLPGRPESIRRLVEQALKGKRGG